MNTTMYERGFGTGHGLDLRAIQVDIDGKIHNVLRQVTAASALLSVTEPIPVTMCGLSLDAAGEPFSSGPTTCLQCGLLAAWKVVAT